MKKLGIILACILLLLPGAFAYNTIVSLTITSISTATRTCDRLQYDDQDCNTGCAQNHAWVDWKIYDDTGVAKSERHYSDVVGGGVSSAVSVTSGDSYDITGIYGTTNPGDCHPSCIWCYLGGTHQGDIDIGTTGLSFNYIA